jgi:hypothetical protein
MMLLLGDADNIPQCIIHDTPHSVTFIPPVGPRKALYLAGDVPPRYNLPATQSHDRAVLILEAWMLVASIEHDLAIVERLINGEHG